MSRGWFLAVVVAYAVGLNTPLRAAPALPTRGFVQEFDTVVQLLSTSPTQLSTSFTCKGLTAINDGLGGKFYYYAGDITATNDTDCFAWGAGRLRRFNDAVTASRVSVSGSSSNYAGNLTVAKMILDVRTCGAMGNYDPNTGTGADDSDAIQVALDAAAEDGSGGIVWLPKLNYRLTKPISIPATVTLMGQGMASGYNAWPGGPNFYWTSPCVVGVYMTNRSSVIQNVALFGMGNVGNVIETLNENNQVLQCQVLGGTNAGIRIGDYANNELIWNCDISHNGTGVLADGVSSTQSKIDLSRIHYNTNNGLSASAYLNFVVDKTVFEANGNAGAYLAKQDGLTMDQIGFYNCWFENNRGGNLITTNISSNPSANVGTIIIGPSVRWTEIGINIVPGFTNGFSKISSTYNFQVHGTVFAGPMWIDTNVTQLSFQNCPFIGAPSPDANTNAIRFVSFDNPGTDKLMSMGLYGAETMSVDTNGLIRARGGLYVSTTNPTNVLGTVNMLAINGNAAGIDASGNGFFGGTLFANLGHFTNSVFGTSVNGDGGIIGGLSIRANAIGVNAEPVGIGDFYGSGTNAWFYVRGQITGFGPPDPSINGLASAWNESGGAGETVLAFNTTIGTNPHMALKAFGDTGSTNMFLVYPYGPVQLRGITKAEKTAITSPQNGMLVYQTDNTPGLRVYVNGAWVMVSTVADP